MQKLGHHFTDTKLMNLALTHRSYGSPHNERLEFLGDSILNCLIAEALYQRFTNAREGDLSPMRAQLVKGTTLAQLSLELGVGDYLKLGSGELKSGGARRESTLADALEALVGAIYLDAGMDVCRQCVWHWYASRLAGISPSQSHKDAKTRLQEFLQARKIALPSYELLDANDGEHQQNFTVMCDLPLLKKRAIGTGGSRRKAEQEAATAALTLLHGKKSCKAKKKLQGKKL